MPQSNSEFLKMIASLQALTGASGVNLSNIMGDFIDCVAWRGTAEMLCKHFTKGRMIGLSGRLQVRTWMDQDGAKRKAAEVIADSIYFADSKPSSGAGQQQENVQSDADPECSGYPIIEDDGEFPF